jgi:MIP family channel proteins
VYNLPQKLVAELVGTCAFVLLACGAVCMDQSLHINTESLGWLGLAWAFGLSYAVFTTIAAPVSGGHLNPAITLGMWVTRRLSTLDTIFYIAAQLAGATLGAWALTHFYSETIWRAAALGATSLSSDVTRIPAMAVEAVLTFFLAWAFFGTWVAPDSASRQLGGLLPGLAVMLGVLVGGPITGAAMNPARSFGPSLIAQHWSNHGVYWVGPLLGAVVASWIYDRLYLRNA